MFKVCGIIGISKIAIFNFSRTEWVKKKSKKIKSYPKPPKLVKQSLFKQVQKNANNFFREYPISFLMIYRLIDFALVIPWLLMFTVC